MEIAIPFICRDLVSLWCSLILFSARCLLKFVHTQHEACTVLQYGTIACSDV